MNVLAIGAHPDDIEVLFGGTLARYAQAGAKVILCVVTDGRSHPIGDPDVIARTRREEAQAAAGLIGADLHWLGVPDGTLAEDLPSKLALIEVIAGADPDIILTHPPEDYHADHVATSRLVMAAVQAAWAPPSPLKVTPLRKSVPVALGASSLGINFSPEEYVDITPVWEIKLNLVLQHRSQFLPGPSYTVDQVKEPYDQYYGVRITRIMSEFYGIACNVAYAEAFRWWRAADRLVPRRLLP